MLFTMLYKAVLTCESVDEIVEMKATEQYFHTLVLPIMLYKVVLL